MLRQLKVPIYHSEPRKLADIPSGIERLGQLMGTEQVAKPVAARSCAPNGQPDGAVRATPARARVLPGMGQAFVYPQRFEHHQRLHARVRRTEYLRRDEGGGARRHAGRRALQEDPEVIFGTSEKSDPRSEGGLAMWRAFPSMTAARITCSG